MLTDAKSMNSKIEFLQHAMSMHKVQLEQTPLFQVWIFDKSPFSWRLILSCCNVSIRMRTYHVLEFKIVTTNPLCMQRYSYCLTLRVPGSPDIPSLGGLDECI